MARPPRHRATRRRTPHGQHRSRSLHDVGLSAWFGGTLALVKTGLTAAALGATAYSRMLGHKVSADHDVLVESGTEPAAGTPAEAAEAQRQLKVLQWVVPAVTGAFVVMGSFAGEQQRPHRVADGVADGVGARLRRKR
jgi:hypothetical protein